MHLYILVKRDLNLNVKLANNSLQNKIIKHNALRCMRLTWQRIAIENAIMSVWKRLHFPTIWSALALSLLKCVNSWSKLMFLSYIRGKRTKTMNYHQLRSCSGLAGVPKSCKNMKNHPKCIQKSTRKIFWTSGLAFSIVLWCHLKCIYLRALHFKILLYNELLESLTLRFRSRFTKIFKCINL